MKRLSIYILIFLSFLLISCTKEKLNFPVSKIEIVEGDNYQLQPTYNLDNIKYKTEDENIAIVTYKGLILAINQGSTKIIVTYEKQTVIINVEVTKKPSDPKDEIRDLNVYFIDVGQADAIFIELPSGDNMMIDAGYGYGDKEMAWANITNTLNSLDIEIIDHFIITHNHSDHYGFVPDIISTYGISNIYGSGSKRTNTQYLNIINSIEEAGLEYYVVEIGDLLVEEEYLTIQVVATRQDLTDDDDPNINSVMVRLEYKDTSFMFTGDGGAKTSNDAEYTALKSGLELDSDVLKVGHHGSKYSSSNSFLQAVSPTYAIITTEENSSDNLPTVEALNRIKTTGAIIYQTKDYGTILVNSDGTNITISTER